MENRVGQQLGNYQLTHIIGQGGFADVYRGRHVHLNTLAAIKVLQMRLVGSNLEQFRNEARAIASLVHPHIVRVLDFGITNDIPFLVMDYAPHGTLRQRHKQGVALSPAEIVPYVKQVAAALQYAHDKRFIHRDIKPENMLMGQNNELLLSDFGLALITQSSSSRSLQEMAGTASYMAPEQLEGRPRRASDQYSLGIVVYEWLTGERPFNGSFVEIASQHMLVPPPPLHTKIAGIPSEIEEVVLTALNKEPEQRFENVQAFANAFEQAVINLYADTAPLAPYPVMSVPQSPLYSERHSYVMTPPEQGSVSRRYTPPPSYPVSQPMAINTPFTGNQDVQPGMALPLTQNQYPHVYTPQNQAPISGPQQASQFVHTPAVAPASSPSQRRFSRRTVVLGLTGIVALGACGGTTALAASGGLSQTLRRFGFLTNPTAPVAPQPDPTSKPDPTPAAPLGTVLATFHSSKWIWTLAWSPDGKYIASSGDDPIVYIWDAQTGKQVSTYHGHVDKLAAGNTVSVISLAWSPDGTRIVSVGDVSSSSGFMPDVQVWEIASGKFITSYTGHNPQPGHENLVTDVAWSPDGTRIVSAGSYDKTAQVWDAHTGATQLTYRGHAYDVWKVRWSPDGKHIASASGDPGTPSTGGDVQVWDTQGNHVVTYTGHVSGGHTVEVLDIAWSPDSQYIASTGRDGGIQVWKALTGSRTTSYQGSENVSWSPDGKFTATSTYASGGIPTIQILGALTGKPVYSFHGLSQQINGIQWSPSSAHIASGGADEVVLVWQAE